ncbi:MAG: SRPBCC domain-containing protein [Anaerolineales bacterium]
MNIEFVVSAIIPALPEEIYQVWLSSEGHSAMAGSPASISAIVGNEFNAWDGYIHGKNLERVPGIRIVQSWRTSEFSADEPDSRVEITLESAGKQTRLTLKHTVLPPSGWQYEQGWIESYFEPMQKYFTGRRDA